MQTTAGKLRGLIADGIHVFRDVRYGAPTGGVGRFRPPRPVEPWTGIPDALAYGDMPPQQVVQLAGGIGAGAKGASWTGRGRMTESINL